MHLVFTIINYLTDLCVPKGVSEEREKITECPSFACPIHASNFMISRARSCALKVCKDLQPSRRYFYIFLVGNR